MSSNAIYHQPLRRIRGRGFSVPYGSLPCYCDRYMNYSPEPSSGSGYCYPHHNSDCKQSKFQEIFKQIWRFRRISGGIYRYAAMNVKRYNTWRRRTKPTDRRFVEDLALWLLVGGQRVVLTPFDPDGTGENLSREAIIELVKSAVEGWDYGQKTRLLGWLGKTSQRDLSDLILNPLALSRTNRQVQLEAARLEESLGSLGVGEATYLEEHKRWGTAGACQDILCTLPHYEEVQRRFRAAIMGLYSTFWREALSMPDISKEEFEERENEVKAQARAIKARESRERHAELNIHLMPEFDRFAVPEKIFREVMGLAESSSSTDQQVAGYIAEASRDTLAAPYKEWQQAKLEMPMQTQRILANMRIESLVRYILARTWFEQAEQLFLEDVNEVLRMRLQKTPAKMSQDLEWRFTKDPPAVPRIAA